MFFICHLCSLFPGKIEENLLSRMDFHFQNLVSECENFGVQSISLLHVFSNVSKIQNLYANMYLNPLKYSCSSPT